jgi:hypothetical protein
VYSNGFCFCGLYIRNKKGEKFKLVATKKKILGGGEEKRGVKIK